MCRMTCIFEEASFYASHEYDDGIYCVRIGGRIFKRMFLGEVKFSKEIFLNPNNFAPKYF